MKREYKKLAKALTPAQQKVWAELLVRKNLKNAQAIDEAIGQYAATVKLIWPSSNANGGDRINYDFNVLDADVIPRMWEAARIYLTDPSDHFWAQEFYFFQNLAVTRGLMADADKLDIDTACKQLSKDDGT